MIHKKNYKEVAFNQRKRPKLNLLGRYPFEGENLNKQLTRIYKQFTACNGPAEKSKLLIELYHNHQALFYKFALNNLSEVTPIIYTPYVAELCANFSLNFKYSPGAYLSYPDRKNMRQIIDNVANNDIEIVVVTDGERVLGIGDQGVGGIHICVGKLMLYTLLGGIDPKKTLPIVLDVGTNNQKLLADPLYLGWRHKRLTGKPYYSFVNDFVTKLKKRAPKVLLQWEDFGKNNAWQLLDRYRNKLPSFNDDIQGTAAVTLAAILAAIKITKTKFSEQRIVVFGAGSAAIGLVKLLLFYAKTKNCSENKLLKNLWLVDYHGLVTDLTDNTEIQRPYLKKSSEINGWKVKNRLNISLIEVVKNIKPTILLGFSAVYGAFTRQVVTEMAKQVKRPIIFPLSNPTTKAEASPQNLIKWTNAKAVIATGGQFKLVNHQGKKISIAQCNNALIFPGVGLGAIISQPKTISDQFFLTAALTLFKYSPALKNRNAALLPKIEQMPKISKVIAKNIAKLRFKSKDSSAKINRLINKNFWLPKC